MGVILVVDDEVEICNTMKKLLTGKGYAVYTALNGESAVKVARDVRPQVVLLDVIMPGMWGRDVIKEIHKIDPLIAIVMVTAVADTEEINKAMKAGALEYIVKPIDLKKLLELLSKLIRQENRSPVKKKMDE